MRLRDLTHSITGKIIALLIFAVQLTACVDDGSDAVTSGITGGGAGGSSTAPASNVVLGGSVGDGPVTGATVYVFNRNGDLVGSMLSDNTATFKSTFKVKGNEYPLLLKTEGGIDLVTGLEPDFHMVSVMLNPSDKQVNINPFSTLAVKIAAQLPGGISQSNVSMAMDYVIQRLGFGLDLNVVPDPITTTITDENVANLVKASEALGEMVRRTRDRFSYAGGTLSGDDVIAALSADMVDGFMDGEGATGTDAGITAVANIVSGQVLVESLSNKLKVGGVVATAVIDQAIAITRSSTSIKLTDSVRITQGMLKQTRAALAATRVLDSGVHVSGIVAAVDMIVADSLPLEADAVLPDDASGSLEYAVSLVSTADDITKTEINQTVRLVESGGTVSENTVPVISGVPATSVTANSGYVFQPGASDADGDVLTFSIANMPGWASFNTTSGRLSGTPVNGDAGTYSGITITVTDGQAAASLPAFTLQVDAVVASNSAPVISGSPATSVTANSGYEFQPDAVDADGDTLTFSIANKPAWASFNATSGRLSGTPDNGDAGTYSGIMITVTDGQAAASLPAFTLQVDAVVASNSAPVISGSPATSVTANSSYVFQPGATDADGDALTFSIANMPGWASFNTTSGRLSGTPDNGDAGTYSGIMVTVTDGQASASLPAFSLRVDATNTAPVISGSPATSVTANSSYVFQPSATDADGDVLTFSIANKPAWASFNTTSGRLSGTPDNGDADTYSNIMITVSDGQASASLPAFSLRVDAGNTPPVISGASVTSVTANSSYVFQPNASDADGDLLSFSIANKPAWASFDDTSGRLTGTPADSDVGSYANIVIAVSDGVAMARLAAFDIQVDPALSRTGSFSLNWTAPVARADGTPLSLADIDGYRVYYGSSQGNYPNSIDVTDGAAVSTTVSNVPAGNYYVVMSTYDMNGLESAQSSVVIKTAR